MYYLIAVIVAFVGGCVTAYFVMRNNPKYFNIDEMLKAKRDDLIALGKAGVKEKLDKLKSKIDDALSQ